MKTGTYIVLENRKLNQTAVFVCVYFLDGVLQHRQQGIKTAEKQFFNKTENIEFGVVLNYKCLLLKVSVAIL